MQQKRSYATLLDLSGFANSKHTYKYKHKMQKYAVAIYAFTNTHTHTHLNPLMQPASGSVCCQVTDILTFRCEHCKPSLTESSYNATATSSDG